MKPKFIVSYEGTLNLWVVRYWKADKSETIPHEAYLSAPFNSFYHGWLFSDADIAEAFAAALNTKMKNTIKKFQKLNCDKET